jgi:hypothetical protein
MHTTATRPIGVTILAALAAAFGVFALLAGMAVFGFGAFVSTSAGLLSPAFSAVGFLVLVLGVAELLFAYGAWLLRTWAWQVGLTAWAASVGVHVLWLLAGASVGAQLLSIAASLAVLYYLDTPAVRTAFGQQPGSRLRGLIGR